MSQDKKSKKDDIEKLRELLDDVTFKNLDPEDEKHLIALKERLSKPERTITFTQKAKSDEIDPMKPKVLVHIKKEQKLVITKEEADKKTEIEYTKKTEGFIDEDIFEIEKVKVEGPEFIEVKPKDRVEEEKVTIGLEDKTTLAEEELREWEPVEEKKKEKISDITKKEFKGINFCSNCGISLDEVRNFCPKCGENLDFEKKIEEPTSSKLSAEEERLMKTYPFKTVKSIDDETAILLYDNGYSSIDILSMTSVKNLSKIKGISKTKAKEIIKDLTPQVEEFEEIPVEIKPISTSETAVVEVTEGQIVSEEKLISDDEKIEVFKDMNSINDEAAILLYNSGYTSFVLLQETTLKDLRKIKGLKRKIAKNIIQELNVKNQEESEVKPISIDESSEGEISENDIQTEPEKTEEKTGKTSPVKLHTTTAEWIPVEEEKTWEPAEEKISKPSEEELEEFNKKVETFKDIESIDNETAVILYDNGYTSLDLLTIATVKDLSKINGIKKKNAKQIKKEIEEKTEWKTPIIEEEKPIEEVFIDSEDELIVDEKLKKNQDAENEIKINAFKELKSVDEQIALLLYDNGYTSIESLNDVKVKDLSQIKGIKKIVAKNIIEEIEDRFKEKSEDVKLIEDKGEEIEQDFVEEETKKDVQEVSIEEEQKKPFEKINSINDKIYRILMENGINSLQDLDNLTIKDLTKIRGIRKKIAKKIKQEVKMELEKAQEPVVEKYYYDENSYIKKESLEEDEWESFDEAEISDGKTSEVQGFRHGGYTLYEKEIDLKDGNKRKVRFFSKGESEHSKPIKLPKGYEVKENKKTGVPYLRKKK